MHDDHERWADSVAPYLLGALPEDETEAFEAHLAHCADCREELDVLVPAVHALPASVEPVAPPPALKARIMAEVEREASLLAAAGPEADRPPARERRRRWHFSMPRLAPLAAAAALLFVGVGDRHRRHPARLGRHEDGHRQGRHDRGAAGPARAQARRRHGDADRARAPARARGPRLPGVGQAARARIPSRPPRCSRPRKDGTATAMVPGPLDGVEQMLVTDEPAGGSRVPTRRPFLVASMS